MTAHLRRVAPVAVGLAVALGLITAPRRALASDYYVDSQAGDDNQSGAWSTPWKSLARVAAQALGPADRVFFARGSHFTGSLQIEASGTAEQPLTLGSYGTGAAPLFSNTDFALAAGNSLRLAGSYVVVDGLHFADAAAAPSNDTSQVFAAGALVILPTAKYVTVKNCEFSNDPVGLRVNAPNALVENNLFRDCSRFLGGETWGPIALFVSAGDVEVSHNYFRNYQAIGGAFGADGGAIELDNGGGGPPMSGIRIHHNYSDANEGFIEVTARDDNTEDLRIFFNVSNDFDQFALFWEGRNIRVENNTVLRTRARVAPEETFFGALPGSIALRNNLFVVKPGLHVLEEAPKAGQTHDHNLVFSLDQQPGALGQPLGVGDVEADPKFVDIQAGNLRLRADSPAIDQATALGYTQDFEDRPVPAGLAPDMGAFEFQSAAISALPPPMSPMASAGAGGVGGSSGVAGSGGEPAAGSANGGTANGGTPNGGSANGVANGGTANAGTSSSAAGGQAAASGNASTQAGAAGAPTASPAAAGCGCRLFGRSANLGRGPSSSALLLLLSLLRRRARRLRRPAKRTSCAD